MIFYSDYYGIDTPDPEHLLANQHADLASMCRYIGADSLAFLSIDGLYDAVGGVKRDPANPQFTDHQFTGDYPTGLTDLTGRSKNSPKTLSLMKEAS
jgi:amidophosphoribosyltransferase